VPRTVTAARPRAGRELALLASLYLAYSVARLMTDADLGTATGNAWALLRVEGAVHLDVERSLNDALTAVPGLPLLASYWYSVLHYVVTPAVLVWVYRAHPDRYGVARNALVIGSALGIVGFALLPMAPRHGCCRASSTPSPPRPDPVGGARTRARREAWAA
jgi:hypothetical protein